MQLSPTSAPPSALGAALPRLPVGALPRLRLRTRRPLALLAAALACGVVGWGMPPLVMRLPVIEVNPPSLSPRMLLAPAVAGGLELVAPPVLAALPGPAPRLEPVPLPRLPGVGELLGDASYYAAKFEGRRTASGEQYRGHRLTAAHRTLPFGTKVRVVNLRNGRSVVVRINDRGPFHAKRVVDLSRAAASRIGILERGRAKVRLEVL